MAATLTKNGGLLIKTRRDHQSLHYLWNTRIKSSIPEPAAARKNTGDYQLHQIKQFSRFTQPIFRKNKRIQFPPPSKVSPSSEKSGLVGWYLRMLKTRPVSTKSITSSLIYAAADVSSQTIVGESIEKYNLVRTLRMAGYGLLILGPSVHFWYNFMSRVFPKRDLLSTFKKIALGQTVYGPSMTVIFLSVNASFQGESGAEIVARLNRDLVSTMINGVMYWPFCDFVTFKFVPVHLQPLVTNSFSYLWTVYLTYTAGLAKVSTSE
ncbi:hypothetical protein ABFS82_02G042200 [Erythranthe guttata]|uniref:Uncharacterized protein n=1 Tax=Erythranthe guttata TaxID=4155 RepID=A0A022RC27_ERYGU|nr:PREDICTED: PXMP2/4 family protein 4 [Erythranthe guttata]EYU37589.1 hypothetical protein MIMGU_mgv1a011998mg [Erythranthe guttata]|eukprot:XP_012836864.1 PREDICTED: PXMP2/4 family protein 4 [Erythranthe guttata]